MPGETQHDWDAGGDHELPRFLSTQEDTAQAAPRGLNGVSRDTLMRGGALALVSSMSLCASAFLAPEGALRRAAIAPVLEVKTVRFTAKPVPAVEDIEERLSFASRMQTQMAALKLMPAVAPVAASEEAPLQDAAPAELVIDQAASPDPAALLIVRNLPPSVSFNDGVPSGIGEWALGGQDPEDLVTALKDGPAEDVTAAVELVSGAGVSLGTRTLVLPKARDVPPIATISDAAQTETVKAHFAATEEPPVKPKRRHMRVRAAQVEDVAQDESEQKPQPKRRKHRANDAYRAQAEADAAQQQKEKSEAEAAPQSDAEKEPQGPVAKFFAWLKGGSTTKPKPGRPADEYDGTLRGLGMSPQE